MKDLNAELENRSVVDIIEALPKRVTTLRKFPDGPSRIPEFPEELKRKFNLPEHQNRIFILANNWHQYEMFKIEHNLAMWMCVYVPHDVNTMTQLFTFPQDIRVIALEDWWLAVSPAYDFAFEEIQRERNVEVVLMSQI